MVADPIQIKRYPNRRYYARHTSNYVSLQEIDELIRAGHTVEIRDSQTGEDITRTVLAHLILERQPDKMSLFPTDMLHFILRSNDVMADFLRDYFRHSLTYLDYLQRHGAAGSTLTQPMHWVQAWLERMVPQPSERVEPAAPADDAGLAERVEQLEQRLRELEAKD